MSRLQVILAYDCQLIEELSALVDAAKATGSITPLRRRLEHLPEVGTPRDQQKNDAQLRQLLDLNAPQILIDQHVFDFFPKRFLLAKLDAGEVPSAELLAAVAQRRKFTLDDTLWSARWLCDSAARHVRESSKDLLNNDDSTVLDAALPETPNSLATRALFGSEGFALLSSQSEHSAWYANPDLGWHHARGLKKAIDFLTKALDRPAPSIKAYERAYIYLHRDQYYLGSSQPALPSKTALTKSYERFLLRNRKFITRLISFYEACQTKSWSAHIIVE